VTYFREEEKNLLIEEIERVLGEELTDANIEAIESGFTITTVLQREVMESYIGNDPTAKCEEIVSTLAMLTKRWGFRLEIHYYFLPYHYIYMLLISRGPADDDGDFLEVPDSTAVLLPIPPTPAQERPMVMSAKAGGR
jgi:hypothetical protein